jgi:pimeloyl-ACP methyl ester carboxylesterase
MPVIDDLWTNPAGSITHYYWLKEEEIGNGNENEKSLSPIFLFIHGAGHSLQSWHFSMTAIRKEYPKRSQYFAYDLYGHGQCFWLGVYMLYKIDVCFRPLKACLPFCYGQL